MEPNEEIQVGAKYQRRFSRFHHVVKVITLDLARQTVVYETDNGSHHSVSLKKFKDFHYLVEPPEGHKVNPDCALEQIAEAVDTWRDAKAKLQAAEAEADRLKQAVKDLEAKVVQVALKMGALLAVPPMGTFLGVPQSSMWTTPVDPNAPAIQEAQIDPSVTQEDIEAALEEERERLEAFSPKD